MSSNFTVTTPGARIGISGTSWDDADVSITRTIQPMPGDGGADIIEPPSIDPESYAAQNGYGWLTGALLDKFGELWDETGDPFVAENRLRDTGIYERTFRGIKRDDGTLRMSENEYRAFRFTAQEMGDELGFRITDKQFVSMVERDVEAREFVQASAQAFDRFREPGSSRDNGLTQQFIDRFADTGSAQGALEEVRASDLYDEVFAGNRRQEPDGSWSLRMDEQDYFSYKRGWQRLFLKRGLNPEPFMSKGRLKDAVEAEVSIQELDARIGAVEEGILGNRAEVAEFFTNQYGQDATAYLSEEGTLQSALAMAIDPEIGNELLTRRITASQIGGEAAVQGFARSVDRAEELARAGIGQGQARQLYGEAAARLPGLSATTRRFNRGETGIGEFEGAMALGDAEGQLRLTRALQSEQSSFGSRRDVRRDQRGFGLSGLRQR